ncbi:MAG: NAD-dependent DNA ligase LigA [Patescibacteria group bacterium]|nr:NAD-dependent DNA ligase LigA [Patescibacteria group bacterium]
MNPIQAQKRAQKLRAEIDRLRYEYHVLNKPKTTDEIYTSLRKELKELEEKFPRLKSPGSPTERIAGKPLEKFQKTVHRFRQWSLDDAFSAADLENWEKKNLRFLFKKIPGPERQALENSISYSVEPKIDGLHIVLTYEKGLLKTGATRGDGRIGEDVTSNIKTIESIPLKLKKPVDIVVEGECWLSKKELERINKKRARNNLPLFANPRNAAAGSIRQLDPRVAQSRNLDSFVYDLHVISGLPQPKSQEQELKALIKLGFKVNRESKIYSGLKPVEKLYEKLIRVKDRAKFGLDGLVIKVNQKKIQDVLDYTGKAPRFAIAYKFPAQQVTTVIKGIHLQIGRTGALTPVARLKPVNVSGSVVRRATLHNLDEINRLDARIGDTVIIRKAGDIIPEVVEVMKNLRTGREQKFSMPARCPQCRGPIGRRKIKRKTRNKTALKYEVAYYCLNPQCFSIQKEKIIHFASKKAFNVEGLGPKIIEQLMNQGLIKDAADIFFLKTRDLEPLDLFAQKKAQNIIQAVKSSKKIPLHRFIFALGIRHVGEQMARILAQNLTKKTSLTPASLARKIAALTPQELESIAGAGQKISQSVREFTRNKNNQKLFKKLDKAGVEIIPVQSPKKSNKLSGKTFVITGTLPGLSREKAKEKIIAQGGKASSSVSPNTDYLLAGENPGTKLRTARKLGVKVIFIKEFKKITS